MRRRIYRPYICRNTSGPALPTGSTGHILAAIGKVESGHGTADSYGCILGPPTPYAYGPMQSLVSSWATLGIDGNGDGIVDSCDYEDAIPSTANYLLQSGAPRDYYSAIYACNHSDLYLQSVLAQARTYYQVYVTGVYSWPLA
jgi:hypothetical protein